MATINITINMRDPIAAIDAVKNVAENWSQDRRDKFADEFNRLCEDRSVLNFVWEDGVLVIELSPKAMALLRRYSIGEIM